MLHGEKEEFGDQATVWKGLAAVVHQFNTLTSDFGEERTLDTHTFWLSIQHQSWRLVPRSFDNHFEFRRTAAAMKLAKM